MLLMTGSHSPVQTVGLLYSLLFSFPVGIIIGFSQEAYTVAEDGGNVTLRVALLKGKLSFSVYVNISLVIGTAIGKLLCSNPIIHVFHC